MTIKDRTLGMHSAEFVIPNPSEGLLKGDIMDSLHSIKDNPEKKWLFEKCNQEIYVTKIDRGVAYGRLVSNDPYESLLWLVL